MKLQISHLGTAEQIITKNILTLFLFDPTWFKRSILSLLLICRRSNLLKDMNGVTKMPYSYLSENSRYLFNIFILFLCTYKCFKRLTVVVMSSLPYPFLGRVRTLAAAKVLLPQPDGGPPGIINQ